MGKLLPLSEICWQYQKILPLSGKDVEVVFNTSDEDFLDVIVMSAWLKSSSLFVNNDAELLAL